MDDSEPATHPLPPDEYIYVAYVAELPLPFAMVLAVPKAAAYAANVPDETELIANLTLVLAAAPCKGIV